MPFLMEKTELVEMNKTLRAVFFLLLLACVEMPGKAAAQGAQYVCRLRFADKQGSPALTNPAAFLSPRALARRARFGIAVMDDDRPVSPRYIDSALQISSGKLHTLSRWRNEMTILLPDTTALPALRAKSWITAVETVGNYAAGLHKGKGKTPDSTFIPTNNPTSPLQKAAANAAYYAATWDQTQLVAGQTLHDAGYTGAGMLIAVIDEYFSGADTHPGFVALHAQGRLVDSFDFVRRSTTTLYSTSTHGTNCLSDIAGYQPNVFVGAAPDASIALYVTENPASEQRAELDQMTAGMERADSMGVDVISASLGYNTFSFPANSDFLFSELDGKTTSVAQAANTATAKGMLVVVAAGNEGNNTAWGRKILTPGDADSALTVGSVAVNGVSSSFSGFGPNAAGRVKPDVCGMGQAAAVYNSSGGFFNGSGTSFATPQIAGFAACLWQAFPNKKPGEIRDAIVRSASLYNNPDAQQGYGIPDFGAAFGTLGIPVNLAGKLGVVNASYQAADNSLLLSRSDSGGAQVSLLDLAGRVITTATLRFTGNQTLVLPLPQSLASGIYILRYKTEGAQGAVKLLMP